MSKAGINPATTHRSYTELVEDYILMIKAINDERRIK
jgi:DNA-binding transcriptional regulator YhcF (GntR family)